MIRDGKVFEVCWVACSSRPVEAVVRKLIAQRRHAQMCMSSSGLGRKFLVVVLINDILFKQWQIQKTSTGMKIKKIVDGRWKLKKSSLNVTSKARICRPPKDCRFGNFHKSQ